MAHHITEGFLVSPSPQTHCAATWGEGIPAFGFVERESSLSLLQVLGHMTSP